MLSRRLQRRPNIKPPSVQRPVLVGQSPIHYQTGVVSADDQ